MQQRAANNALPKKELKSFDCTFVQKIPTFGNTQNITVIIIQLQ